MNYPCKGVVDLSLFHESQTPRCAAAIQLLIFLLTLVLTTASFGVPSWGKGFSAAGDGQWDEFVSNDSICGRFVARVLVWNSEPVTVTLVVPKAEGVFLYASPNWPMGWFSCFPHARQIFLYYREDAYADLSEKLVGFKAENRSIYMVLDPESSNRTLLDLYYDTSARLNLLSRLASTILNLTALGVDGFVLGDEWPRGYNTGLVTIDMLTPHNSTYFAETGRWIRPVGGDREEKALLADWFYNRSVATWNMIGQALRAQFPNIVLGTNVDLFWKPDYSGPDVAFWKAGHWIDQLDLEPYSLVVSHYFTQMPRDSEPGEVDNESLGVLNLSVDRMLAHTKPEGKPVYLLLAAHYNEPVSITPAQMIAEYNTLADKDLEGIGWFAFDIWETGLGESRWRETSFLGDQPTHKYRGGPVYIPLRHERFLTLRALTSLRWEALTEQRMAELTLGCQAKGCKERTFTQLSEEEFLSAKFSPSGEKVLVLAQTQIQIRNASKLHDILAQIHANGNLFVSADWSPDEEQIAYTTTGGVLGLVEVSRCMGRNVSVEAATSHTCQVGEALTQDWEYKGCVAWSPLGDFLACQTSQGVLLLEISDIPATPDTHSSDSEKASSSPRSVRLIKTANTSLCGWSFDGRYLAISNQTGVSVWQIEEETGGRLTATQPAEGCVWGSASWSCHDHSLAWAANRSTGWELVVWNVDENSTKVCELHLYEEAVTCSAWRLAGDRIAMGTSKRGIIRVDLGNQSLRYKGYVRYTASPAPNPLDFSSAFWVRWLPPRTGKMVPFYRGPVLSLGGPAISVRYSPAETMTLLACWPHLLSSGTDTEGLSIRFSQDVLAPGLRGRIYGLDWSPNGERVAVSLGEPEDVIRVWRVERDGENRLVQALWDEDSPRSLTFSRDGGTVAYSTGDGAIKLWHLGENIVEIVDAGLDKAQGACLLSYSPDGTHLAVLTPCPRHVDIIDLRDLGASAELPEDVLWVDWSPKGQLVATGHPDGIWLWAFNGSQLVVLSTTPTDLQAGWVAFSRDGDLLAAVLTPQGQRPAEVQVFQVAGTRLLPIHSEKFMLEPTLADGYSSPLSWHPNLSVLATCFGLKGYEKPWREEWIPTRIGDMQYSPRWFWFEQLRPGIALWRAEPYVGGAGPSSCFPTLTSVNRYVEWSPTGTWILTASEEGWLLLWQISSSDYDISPVGEALALMVAMVGILLVAMTALLGISKSPIVAHMLYPICPDCKAETNMTKGNHKFDFICEKCGKKLHDN